MRSNQSCTLGSAPVLASLIELPIAAAHFWSVTPIHKWFASPVGQTDILVLLYISLLILIYTWHLPVHATVTVRCLLPIPPRLVYLLTRLAPVHRAVQEHGRELAATYATGVSVGGQLLVLLFLIVRPALDEAVQFHALLGLATAIPLAVWIIIATLHDEPHPRIGAVCLGLAGAARRISSCWPAGSISPRSASLPPRPFGG